MKDARHTRTTVTDVLIAGAGPAGLALAAELQRLGASPMFSQTPLTGALARNLAELRSR